MTTLATNVTAITPQAEPSAYHPDAHNTLSLDHNHFFANGPDTAATGFNVGSGVVSGQIATILHGSVASPVTTQNATTVYVSRQSNVSAGGDVQCAFVASHTNTGTRQPTAIMGVVNMTGNGDSCGVYSNNFASGTGVVYGYFGNMESNNAAGGAVGIQFNLANTSGSDAPAYDTTFNRWAGFDVYVPVGGTQAAQVGMQIRGGTGQVRVGVGVLKAKEADFRSDSASVAVLVGNGSHTFGVDLIGATISGAYMQYASHFTVQASSGDPIYEMDSGDFLTYLRSSNVWLFNIASSPTLSFNATALAFAALPSANPGAGTKQFWYDAADGNRVKYAP